MPPGGADLHGAAGPRAAGAQAEAEHGEAVQAVGVQSDEHRTPAPSALLAQAAGQARRAGRKPTTSHEQIGQQDRPQREEDEKCPSHHFRGDEGHLL